MHRSISLIISRLPASLISLATVMIFISFFTIYSIAWYDGQKSQLQAITDYDRHLKAHFALMPSLLDNLDTQCKNLQQEKITHSRAEVNFQFFCSSHSIFKKALTTKKYVAFTKIEDEFNLTDFTILKVAKIDEFPITSEDNPHIIILTAPISGRLSEDFYGVIITQYPLHLTGKKIYGKLYSSHKNNKKINNRVLSYKRNVIEHLDRTYRVWRYLPYSQHFLGSP